MFSRNKSLVGLDIGSSAVKLVELKQTKKGLELLHFKMVPLPPEAIVDGAIMNSNAVVDAITELIGQEKLKRKDVAISVSGHSVIVKKIKLPQMTEQELEESIQWEAEQYIPFDITDVNLDVQILGNDEQDVGQMEVLLVAAKKDMINDHTAVVMEAGLQPLVLDVDAFCIENMFEANYGAPQETVVLADIGASLININILRNGISTFTRDISMGGNQFTEEIQKQLNVSREEAESLKLGGELGGPTETTEAVIPQEVGGIIRSVSETMAAEIQRSLDFFAATAADDKIAKIYLTGGSSKVPGLPAIIEQKVGIPVEIANPFHAVQINEKNFNVEHITDVAPAAAVAVGLALRRVGDK
ncbi:MAG TPA: type IV pilus assembly protein PilM [Bdellovibrionota bacterium]|nr:type IV pilus assembly protein PilM [Bdellovibrionota bacterium]